MKYYSISRIETHGIEEFEGERHPAVPKAIFRPDGSVETLGEGCFRSRKRAVKAGREKLGDEIILCDTRRYRLEERLRELA